MVMVFAVLLNLLLPWASTRTSPRLVDADTILLQTPTYRLGFSLSMAASYDIHGTTHRYPDSIIYRFTNNPVPQMNDISHETSVTSHLLAFEDPSLYLYNRRMNPTQRKEGSFQC